MFTNVALTAALASNAESLTVSLADLREIYDQILTFAYTRQVLALRNATFAETDFDTKIWAYTPIFTALTDQAEDCVISPSNYSSAMRFFVALKKEGEEFNLFRRVPAKPEDRYTFGLSLIRKLAETRDRAAFFRARFAEETKDLPTDYLTLGRLLSEALAMASEGFEEADGHHFFEEDELCPSFFWSGEEEDFDDAHAEYAVGSPTSENVRSDLAKIRTLLPVVPLEDVRAGMVFYFGHPRPEGCTYLIPEHDIYGPPEHAKAVLAAMPEEQLRADFEKYAFYARDGYVYALPEILIPACWQVLYFEE